MTKKVNPESSSEKLTAGIGKVSTAISNAYAAQAESGVNLTNLCKIAQTVFKGKAANSIDIKAIADKVAQLRGWTQASAGPRKSEVRKIVRHYRRIPEAVTAYRKKGATFSWHDAMRLLTCLNKEPALRPALALMAAGNSNRAKQTPLKVIGSAISRVMNIDTKATKLVAFQDALESLCEQHEIGW